MSGEQQVVAQAKFRVLSVPNAIVHRDALIARLDAATDCPLSLVVAAPGSGKTALLAEWVNGRDTPAAWMSCDRDDADPLTFWRNVALSASVAWDELGVAAAELRDESSAARIAIGLANTLATRTGPSVLVVDDFHLADADPAVMPAFVAALPGSARLVLGTRADPPFPLGRLRVQGKLLELRQADLRFTLDETRQLLAKVGIDLAEPELGDLMSLTEGWATGVYLAGLRLQTDRDPARLLHSMAETDRSLVDFLMGEVLDLLAPDLVDFLMTSAELESFDVQLCDAVRGTQDSSDMLARVRSANLFLVEAEPTEGSHRYHHLFAQFLRGRLRAVARDRVPAIHRAAAEEYRRRGDLLRAVDHGMAAGDADAAMELLGSYITSTWSPGEGATPVTTARRWLQEGGASGHQSTESILVSAIVLNASGAADEVELWLHRLDTRAAELEPPHRMLLHAAWGYYFLHRGDPASSVEHFSTAMAIAAHHEVHTVWVQALPFMLAQAQLWLDDLDGAEAALEAARIGPARSAVLTRVRLPGLASFLARVRGEFAEAARLARSTLDAADQLELDTLNFGRAEPELTLAAVAIEQDRFHEAEDRLERVLQITEEGRRPPIELLTQLELARLAMARGEPDATAEAIERARATLPSATAPVIARIDQAAALAALESRDLAAAEALCERLPPSSHADLLTARLRLAVDDRTGALAALGSRVDRLATRHHLRIAHGLLLARALAPDDRRRALEVLADVLTLAEPAGFHRTIVSEGPGLWALLESLPATGRTRSYVDSLLAAAHRVVPPPRTAPQAGVVEPLTERELTVLRYLASRLTSTEIARELYVSVNTVRSHVKAIYRKLGVGSRAEAVQHGRRIGVT